MRRPPMFPVMPLLPIGAMVTAAVASVATWRRLRRLEADLLPRPDGSPRSRREVLDDHLRLVSLGDFETDFSRNYHPDVLLLTSFGTYRGRDGLRELTDVLLRQAFDPRFDYHDLQADGQVGYLRWSGRGAAGTALIDGADSYVVRDGRIVARPSTTASRNNLRDDS
jgi:hypothetical protein